MIYILVALAIILVLLFVFQYWLVKRYEKKLEQNYATFEQVLSDYAKAIMEQIEKSKKANGR